MKPKPISSRIISKSLSAIALTLLLGAAQIHATQIVRELWDTFVPGDTPLGTLTGSKTALGFQPAVNWIVNSNSPLFSVNNNGAVNAPGLPPNLGGGLGNIWSDAYVTDTNDLTRVGTLGNLQDPRSWAVRQLTSNAQINFNANGTYYFSFQVEHGNDGIQGIGFANGTNDSARFAGAGITRSSYPNTRFLDADLGNTLYASSGTLGQAGDPGDGAYFGTYPVEGPAMVMAYATNTLGTIVPDVSGVIVGKLTTTAGGNATLQASWFTGAATIPTDPSTNIWDVTYHFSETTTMTHLLIWLTAGAYNNYEDGIRVADSWGEVVGIESKISVSPTNTVPTGQTVVFSGYANSVGETPSYQWLASGVPILDATNANYTNVFPTVTASYTLVVSNAYGLSTNNPSILLTVLPPAAPAISPIPAAESRYIGGYLNLAPLVTGTPPITNSWTKNGTFYQTGSTLAFTNIQATNAGTYVLHASNLYGNTFATNVLTTLTAPGSYVAAIMAQQPYAHYDLSDTTPGPNTPLLDLAGGHDGVAKDTTVVLGVPGPYYTGFGTKHSGVGSARNAPNSSRIDIPITSYTSNMTICAWVRGNNVQNALLLASDGGGYGMNSDGHEYFGIYFPSPGTLGSQWGQAATELSSGLVLPNNEWTFVALVVTPTDTITYMGHPPEALNVSDQPAANGGNTAVIDTLEGTCIGRIDYGWAGPGNAWAGANADFSSVSVFYSSLSGTAITNIYAAAGAPVPTVLHAAKDGTGNVILTWSTGATLEQESDLLVPSWTPVPSPDGNYIVPISPYTIAATNAATTGIQFYRTSQ